MTQDQKHQKPARQKPSQDKEIVRLKETVGPERYQSDVDDPGHPRRKNPGHANPAHNTPGHDRQDVAGQQDAGKPGQGQTQSYPGIQGPKTRALQEDSAMNRDQAQEVVKKK